MLSQSSSDMPMLMEDNNDMSQEMGEMDMSEGSMDGNMPMMMMSMSFEAGTNVTILFKSWKTTDAWTLFGSVIAIIMMGFLYEALKYFREYLMCKHNSCAAQPEIQNLLSPNNQAASSSSNQENRSQAANGIWYARCRKDVCNQFHILQTFLHFIQIGLGYLLMLVAMTYNVWCFLGVLLGCAIGYFTFGWKRYHLSDFSDHCN